ncbi:hypothetical protein [Luteolibacter soli]|uniref:Uncharacterized protein n=1 Tax=Luteolibacter soli TaxID=3135280 RepID=A0ABU9ATV3_9BACT
MRNLDQLCFQVKALRGKALTFLFGLVTAWLLRGGLASAQEAPAFKHPLQRQLEAQILPEVQFQNADFMDALHYLQLQAMASSENTVKVPFALQLPADFKPRYELTLDLKGIPFWEALRHLGGQAGVEFSIVKNSIRVRPVGVTDAEKPAVVTLVPAPESPAAVPGEGLKGLLGKPARPFGAAGGNNHYTTAGEPQPQRSGNQKHRNLSGWSVEDDPGNNYSMNCIDFAKCKAYRGETEKCPCGCFACACQRPK